MMFARTNLSAALVLSLSGALVAACGGSATPAEAPEADASAEEGAEEPMDESAEEGGHAHFDDLSAPEKMKFMKKVVAPKMAKVFQGADAEEYANFNCTNCHGPGAKNGDFEMPSKDLPVLNMAELDWEDPVVKFMSEKVVPTMASLLGEEPYNPETHEGFGCMNCHTTE